MNFEITTIMNDHPHIDLITAYLDGSITARQQDRLNRLIDKGEIDALELKELEATYRSLGKLHAPEPSGAMRSRFYGMLQEQSPQEQQSALSFPHRFSQWIATLGTRRKLSRAALAAVVFIAGLCVGNWLTPFQDYRQELSKLSAEVSQMREVMLLSMLNNKSASERLKAINVSSDIRTADSQVIEALLKTLNNDSNVNVRLAAVDALLHHAAAPEVRQGLVASINRQESPLVQAALADAMLLLQEQKSVEKFRELMRRQELDPGVRDKVENTIVALS